MHLGRRRRPAVEGVWLLAWAGLLAAACEGSGGGNPDGGAGHDGAPDAAGNDPDAGLDTRPPPSGAPLPPGVAPPRVLLGPGATFTGEGYTSCTHQEPPSGNGDRWCVFMPRPHQAELWVINVTRAAAGEVPPCDGSSPHCLRLTDTLWKGFDFGGPIHPYSHAFTGDTLVFYPAAPSAGGTTYRGPIQAWRPGWAAPRRISSERGVMCWGHRSGPVAHCMEDPAGDPSRLESLELRAGRLVDADGPPLPSLGRIRPARPDGRRAWQAGFSPRGDFFVVSSLDPDPALETLRAVATAEIGVTPLREVVRDAPLWEVSDDGRSVFFLRQEMAGTGASGDAGAQPDAGAGSDADAAPQPEPAEWEQQVLYVAQFPSGAGVTRLRAGVREYELLSTPSGTLGVGVLSGAGPGTSAYQMLRDPFQAGALTTVFTYRGGLEGVRVSPDLRFTAWLDGDRDLRIVRHADLTSCDLNVNAQLPAYGPAFLDSSGLVFWTEDTGGDRDRRDGYLADPQDCQGTRRIARSALFIAPVGDRGLVIADEVDDETQAVTLKYAPITAAKHLGDQATVRIQAEVDGASVAGVGRGPMLLLFRAAGGLREDQVTYLFGPLPF